MSEPVSEIGPLATKAEPSIVEMFYSFNDAQKASVDPYGIITQIIKDVEQRQAASLIHDLLTQVPAPLKVLTEANVIEFGLLSHATPTVTPTEGSAGKVKTKGTVKKVSAQSVQKKKLMRSANSYMAFRAFYCVMLPGMTQKQISNVLKPVWDAEPFQLKWTIVAKAYSLVRNALLEDNKARPSMEKFVSVSQDLMGVIPAEKYLDTMGWTVVNTINGPKAIKVFQVDLATLDANIIECTCSVNDIVENFYTAGHIPEATYNKHLNPDSALMGQNILSSAIQSGNAGSEKESEGNFNSVVGNFNQVTASSVGDKISKASNTEFQIGTGSFGVTGQGFSVEQALEISGDKFPYNNQFQPGPSAFQVNPFDGYEYNAFDMGDYIHMNADFPPKAWELE